MGIININYQNMIKQGDHQHYFYKSCKFDLLNHIQDNLNFLIYSNPNQIISNHPNILRFHTIQ